MTPKPITENTLYYGDNLPILCDHVPDESVDLIYVDSPWQPWRTRPDQNNSSQSA